MTGNIWLHIETTRPGFAAALSDASARHHFATPGGVLSVAYNVAGTEAIVKVSGGLDWSPSWMSTPLVKRVYTVADHDEIFAFFYTPAWQGAATALPAAVLT